MYAGISYMIYKNSNANIFGLSGKKRVEVWLISSLIFALVFKYVLCFILVVDYRFL